MKHVLLLFILAMTTGSILTGCKSKASKQETTKQETQQAKAPEVDEVLAQADNLTGKTFTTEAICTHICAHGGGKIFLMGSDDTKTIRVEAGEKIGRFKPETVNNLVRVTGKLVEQRIDEDYLSNWEAQAKARRMKNTVILVRDASQNKKPVAKQQATVSRNESLISGKELQNARKRKEKTISRFTISREFHTK